MAVTDFVTIDWGGLYDILLKNFYALCGVSLAISVLYIIRVLSPSEKVSPYFLFFSVSFTSIVGLTQTLTGRFVEQANPVVYGLSFYTLSLAMWACSTNGRQIGSPLVAGNPLLIITGPVAAFFKPIRHKRLEARVRYFFPFVVLGFFLYQGLARPMSQHLDDLSRTDAVSVLVYATIYELFVYTNFCGVSLMVYGLFGIFGYRVPLNFRQPFSATNIIDFWRGWHTSLSMVLKALFFVPIRRRFGTGLAILIVFMASALWHGISANYILWGAFHAAIFMITRSLMVRGRYFLSGLLFLPTVIVARIMTTDTNFPRLLEKLKFTYSGINLDWFLDASRAANFSVLLALAFVSFECIFRRRRYFQARNYKFYRLPVVSVLILIVTLFTLAQDVGMNYAVYGQR